MKEKNEHQQIIHYLHAFQLESIFTDQIFPYLSLYHFEPGELICSQGDRSEYLYVLVAGKVKIYTSSADGKTLILSFKKPLELIGDIEFVRDIEIINTVEAIAPVKMIGVHYRWIRKYGSDHAPLLQFLLDIITKKFYVKSQTLTQNLMYPVEVRLASYLLSMDESDSAFNGQIPIHIKDTANFIGTSYRHLNRVIQQFCTEGLVERNNGYIVVTDRDGLDELANKNIYE